MTPAEMNKTCEQVAPLLVFYACGETEPDEAAFVEQHLANCAACRAQLSEEQSLQSVFGSLPQDADKLDASGVLLSQCRSELAENLDDTVRPPVLEKTPVLGAFRRWMALRPVWSGTALVAVGLIVGVQASDRVRISPTTSFPRWPLPESISRPVLARVLRTFACN